MNTFRGVQGASFPFLKPPAFQFYADDFLGGTMHFTDAEVGLYMRLLCVQWSTGSLPDDDAELASYGKGQTGLDRVKTKFEKCPDGRLRNQRLEQERAKQTAWREKCVRGGLKSGEKRKGSSTTLELPYELKGNTPVSSLQSPSPNTESQSPADAVVAAWNAACPPLPKCLSLSTARRAAVAIRLKDAFWAANYQAAILRAAASDFALGKTDRGTWRMDFNFFIKPDSVAKIMEGKYDNRTAKPAPHIRANDRSYSQVDDYSKYGMSAQ